MITKAFKTVLFVAFLFLSTNTITAQYGNGYGGNGYGGNGYGGNGYGGYRNSSQNQMNQLSQTPTQFTPKEVPAEVTAAKIVEYYKKELNLDALQEVVITNIYTKSLKKQDVLLKKEISDEDKTKEFKVLSEMTDLEVMEILNKDQKAKYKVLSEDRKNKIESRKH
jgi:hypothetical protein